jgi:ATP-NAD kinase N-terminal domain
MGADGDAPGPAAVGIIVNPYAGKDIRRLVSAAQHTSDVAKIGIVRRAAIGALEQGVDRLVLVHDTHRLAERAVDGLDGPIELIENPLTGSHLDTAAAATDMWKLGVRALVVLGGDGTCRDVATGWPDAPMVAISTGTNNVFPGDVDGTTAGVAAALVASGAVAIDDVSHVAQRVSLTVHDLGDGAVRHEVALVEAALVEATFVGARAVTDPATIRWVVACIAEPAGTGLASIAGRVHPLDRFEPGGVVIHLGPGGRRVRVPLAPGAFSTLEVRSVEHLPVSTPVDLCGGGVLALDGERTTPVSGNATVTASIEPSGPRVIDARRVVMVAALDRRFDIPCADNERKDGHGD